MKSFPLVLRFWQINIIFARNGLDKIFFSIPIFKSFRFLAFFNPWNWFRKSTFNQGEALRKSLEELGPIFIKFGQALSTRPDILPAEVALELCKLQDKVPPFPSEIALAIIENTFGKTADEIFAKFDPVPLASASIAQVHAATLKTGEKVVVKILRPNMQEIISKDLILLQILAKLFDKYVPEIRRFKPKAVVKEFEYTLLHELDLQREAANACQLRRNFANSHLLYVPEIYWDYCRDNILVMERIYGIPVSDIAALRSKEINIKLLAERGVEIFFTQVFRDCFFHADMHPGNVFVSLNNPNNPQYICVDFGIVGTLNDTDKRYLAENLYAFFNRDYKKVAQLHHESGWIPPDVRAEEFESAIRTVCEPIFEKPLKEISFAKVVLQLIQVARAFNMEIQPQLILLQKTLLAVEGLGRQLYPELDLWQTAKPFLEKWLRQQFGPKAFINQVKDVLPFVVERLPEMPKLLHELLELSKQQKLKELEKFQKPTDTKDNKIIPISFCIILLIVNCLSLLQLMPKESSNILNLIFSGLIVISLY